jgi:hypothetical protein
VKPYWLNLTDPIAANCSACADTKKYLQEQNQPMFVYTDLCFLPNNRTQRARIRTNRGNDGPTDTTLFVVNEARTVTIWDDSGYFVCSDGSEPSPRCSSAPPLRAACLSLLTLRRLNVRALSWACKPMFDGSVHLKKLMQMFEYLPVVW